MLLQGVLLGLSLSFMVGPLLFSILQAGIERGFRAGLLVAAGIWTSDLLFITLVYRGVDALQTIVEWPGFRLWSGILGASVLMAFGVGALMMGKKMPEPHTQQPATHRSWLTYWVKGFVLNTINPFTLFFWLGIATALIIPNAWNSRQILIFFSGMMGTLVITDTLKAAGAKALQKFLTGTHLLRVRQGIGALLILFGIVMIIRVVQM